MCLFIATYRRDDYIQNINNNWRVNVSAGICILQWLCEWRDLTYITGAAIVGSGTVSVSQSVSIDLFPPNCTVVLMSVRLVCHSQSEKCTLACFPFWLWTISTARHVWSCSSATCVLVSSWHVSQQAVEVDHGSERRLHIGPTSRSCH